MQRDELIILRQVYAFILSFDFVYTCDSNNYIRRGVDFGHLLISKYLN